MKQKALPIISKWLSIVRNGLRPKSGPLRHYDSASNLQQCLYIMCKKKIGILGVGTRIFLLRYCNLKVPLRFHVYFSRTYSNCLFAPLIFFSDSYKVFGFLIMLLQTKGKKVIFWMFLDFRLLYFFCCLWS